MSYYELAKEVHKTVIEKSGLEEKMREALVSHYYGGFRQSLDKTRGKAGSNRAIYSVGSLHVSGADFPLALKVPLPESETDRAREYIGKDALREDSSLAHELGAFEHLSGKGEQIPAFHVVVEYEHEGQPHFALLTEDLTKGGTCELQPIKRDVRTATVAVHKRTQVDGDKETDYWVDLKNFEPSKGHHLLGKKYQEREMRVNLGRI